jgi:predicted kinase
MSKMYIMRGLPASGKSTRAKEIIASTGNTVRINKDLLRTMLHFDKFTGQNEQKTKTAARALAIEYLVTGINVIIDDTNLNPNTFEYWKKIAKMTKSKVEVIEMDTPLNECLYRDMHREKQVGNTVIKNMALANGMVPAPEKGWILCDIDGTVADLTHRRHFVEQEKKDWKGFFEAMSGDTVILSTTKILIDFYNEGYGIIYVSARPEDYREQTLNWLEANCLNFPFTILMRSSGDKRPDVEVKRDILHRYFPDKSVIKKVIDDRPSVIRMWKEEGLDVIDVGKGIEF